MKQNWTMYIYKTDKRTKTGERLVSTTVWQDRDEASIQRECREVSGQGFRAEAFPTTKTVRNLMTGELVEIPYDTPRSCDPSSELYWSM
jgi:hypothetical protein